MGNEMKPRQNRKGKYDEHFERLDAAPEQVARMIMHSRPKKPDEWEYVNNRNSESTGNAPKD